jgi:hypothetical protein
MALSQIPNPYSTSWPAFVDTLIGFNPILLPNISPNEPWREVAERLTEYAPAAPAPDIFKTWQDWAAALKQAYPD